MKTVPISRINEMLPNLSTQDIEFHHYQMINVWQYVQQLIIQNKTSQQIM